MIPTATIAELERMWTIEVASLEAAGIVDWQATDRERLRDAHAFPTLDGHGRSINKLIDAIGQERHMPIDKHGLRPARHRHP